MLKRKKPTDRIGRKKQWSHHSLNPSSSNIALPPSYSAGPKRPSLFSPPAGAVIWKSWGWTVSDNQGAGVLALTLFSVSKCTSCWRGWASCSHLWQVLQAVVRWGELSVWAQSSTCSTWVPSLSSMGHVFPFQYLYPLPSSGTFPSETDPELSKHSCPQFHWTSPFLLKWGSVSPLTFSDTPPKSRLHLHPIRPHSSPQCRLASASVTVWTWLLQTQK